MLASPYFGMRATCETYRSVSQYAIREEKRKVKRLELLTRIQVVLHAAIIGEGILFLT